MMTEGPSHIGVCLLLCVQQRVFWSSTYNSEGVK